jgi:hypothetical protein
MAAEVELRWLSESVTVTVCRPWVLRIAWKVWAPAFSEDGPGRVALGSVLLKTTVPV